MNLPPTNNNMIPNRTGNTFSLSGVGDQLSNVYNSAASGLKDLSNRVYTGLTPAAAVPGQTTTLMPSTSSFSSSRILDGSRQFLASNGMIAKVSFFLLVLFVFLFLMRFILSIMEWFFRPSGSVHLMDGMYQGNQRVVFSQNPNQANSKIILRSNNESGGIEFTWGLWLYVEELSKTDANIFYKGEQMYNCPQLLLVANSNALRLNMDTFHSTNTGIFRETVDIPNLPMKKWVYVTIRCENNHVDVYINGTIAKRHTLKGVPKQNYGNVYLCDKGGFNGYVSNLWYWNRALTPSEILNNTSKGPSVKSLTPPGDETKVSPAYNYLSLQWFMPTAGTASV